MLTNVIQINYSDYLRGRGYEKLISLICNIEEGKLTRFRYTNGESGYGKHLVIEKWNEDEKVN